MIMKKKIAYLSGFFGVTFFILATFLGGLQLAGYSHISQLISESYAIGTPFGIALRYFGFIPSGLFIFCFSILSLNILPGSALSRIGFIILGIFYGLGTVLVSLFPCDEGCNKELIDPSLAQLIHNLSGLLTYLFVPISLILLGVAARKWKEAAFVSYSGIICGIIAIFFVGVLSNDLHCELAGLYQRIIEGAILMWILFCSAYIKITIKNENKS